MRKTNIFGLFLALAIILTSCSNPASTDDSDNSYNTGGYTPVRPAQPVNASVARQLAWVQAYGAAGGYYIIQAHLANETIYRTQVISYGNRTNITVRILGQGSGRTLSLVGPLGPMFKVEKPHPAGNSIVTLVLENITLVGYNDNPNPLVTIGLGGALEMRTGSVITGNRHYFSLPWHIAYARAGGGVFVSHGVFTMRNNARIHSNKGIEGGGIHLVNNGTLIMRDSAEIYNNNALRGGGIAVAGGRVFMYDNAAIRGNSAEVVGGVCVMSVWEGIIPTSSLNMHGDGVHISDNNSTSTTANIGSGIRLVNAELNISGGTIHGVNAAPGLANWSNFWASDSDALLLMLNSIARAGSYTPNPGGPGVFVHDGIPRVSSNNTITISGNGSSGVWGGDTW